MTDAEFTKLVLQYNKLIFTVCQRFVNDYQEAENLTQDTFLTALRAIDRFVGEDYKPWLVRIAVNKCKDYLKSAYYRTTQTTESELLDSLPAADPVEKRVERNVDIEQLRRACESLPEPYREVALLHFMEDMSFDEIARRLNRPVKTVQTQGYRARDKLKKMLKEAMSDV